MAQCQAGRCHPHPLLQCSAKHQTGVSESPAQSVECGLVTIPSLQADTASRDFLLHLDRTGLWRRLRGALSSCLRSSCLRSALGGRLGRRTPCRRRFCWLLERFLGRLLGYLFGSRLGHPFLRRRLLDRRQRFRRRLSYRLSARPLGDNDIDCRPGRLRRISRLRLRRRAAAT